MNYSKTLFCMSIVILIVMVGLLLPVESIHVPNQPENVRNAPSNVLNARLPALAVSEILSIYKKGEESQAYSMINALYVMAQLNNNNQQSLLNEEPRKVVLSTHQQCKDVLKSSIKQLEVYYHSRKQQLQNLWDSEQFNKHIQMLHTSCSNQAFHQSQAESLKDQGTNCAICIVVAQVSLNYVAYHAIDQSEFIQNKLCTIFGGYLSTTCKAFVHYYGPKLIQGLRGKLAADAICRSIGMCSTNKCKLQSWSPFQSHAGSNLVHTEEKVSQGFTPSWQWLKDLFVKRFGDQHLPPFDLDNDSFSDIGQFRGYHWKGTDCDEFNSKIYPGRKAGNKLVDHDCNGIFGASDTGKSFEEELCGGSKRLGLAVIGDSAGAHFSIPEKYFNVSMIQKGTFNDLIRRIADELDLPQESGYTGHTITKYPSKSVYKHLREWNLCNHNDFQNVGVNGGDSSNTQGNIKALKRSPANDNPLLMFMELIGNDVCGKDIEGMTEPAQFRKNILKLLSWLDSNVPAGSHLILFGLGDGEALYRYLHTQTHPLNVTYPQVYNLLNCLKISPCFGWLNTNDTVRHLTTKRANELNAVYRELMASGLHYKNFDVVYYDFPINEIIDQHVEDGGKPKDLIEPCDGFHPNGRFHSYLGDWLWAKIQFEHPEWIGQKNPHNAKIRQIFGHEILV